MKRCFDVSFGTGTSIRIARIKQYGANDWLFYTGVCREALQLYQVLSDAVRLSSLRRCQSTPTRTLLFMLDAVREEMKCLKYFATSPRYAFLGVVFSHLHFYLLGCALF